MGTLPEYICVCIEVNIFICTLRDIFPFDSNLLILLNNKTHHFGVVSICNVEATRALNSSVVAIPQLFDSSKQT